VASYGIKGKDVQYKEINDDYVQRLNSGRFEATNPFSVINPDTGNMFAGPGAKTGGMMTSLKLIILKSRKQ